MQSHDPEGVAKPARCCEAATNKVAQATRLLGHSLTIRVIAAAAAKLRRQQRHKEIVRELRRYSCALEVLDHALLRTYSVVVEEHSTKTRCHL